MASYAYKAMDGGGRIVSGRMEAASPIDLELRLSRMELDYIDGVAVQASIGFRGAVSRRDLINFFFHLEQLTRSGIPIVDALSDLRATVPDAPLRAVLAGMIESIEGGRTLSQAMAEHSRVFDGVTSGLVRVGEDSGKLPEVLAQLIAALKWQDELAAQTKRLLLYPAFLCAAMLALMVFMMTYLVPKLVGFTKDMGRTLPLHTEILLAVSNFIAAYWHVVLVSSIAAVLAASWLVRTSPKVRYRYDLAKLRLPLFGPILTRIILARFASAFAMMYGSGIAILDAIRATEHVVGNAAIAQHLQTAVGRISAGESVSIAFQNTGLFPPLVIRMLRIGENTGALDTALANIGYFYGRDVREAVERAQALIEPVLTVLMGAVMAWIMLSVFGPIYEIVAGLRT